MTPPFKPGDRVTVRYNKPLGVLTVRSCEVGQGPDMPFWYATAGKESVNFAGPATSLKKVEDDDG